MKNDPLSHGLWETTAPPAPATRPLEGAVRSDVAIVGGGYTGLSAALHLAEAGVSVAVLEAEDVGFGGSGRNVGLVNAGMWVMPDDLPAILGAEHGERLLTLLGDAPRVVFDLAERHEIDCEAVRNGTLHCAVGQSGVRQLEQRARQWAARGAPVRLLDAGEAATRIGSDAYAAALLDERAGTIQPLAYARGLASAAIRAGAAVHTGSRVTRAEADGTGWRLHTERGTLSADTVIVATNAYTRTPWAPVREELVHLPYFNFATPPLAPDLRARILPGLEGAWDTKQILTSFRWDRAGRLVFGSVGALSGTGLAIHRAWAERAMARVFPQLSGTGFEAGWYGQIGMTNDHLPRFHRLARNVVGFSGYNGRGIGPGTVFGKTLAAFVTGTLAEADLPLPVTETVPQSFRSAREGLYRFGAEAAHLSRILV
ncbi:NAD(P)/FAD-dependent oxidoreductase [Nitratireductor pacificus]|uniref:FAD dependent oxidoreductase n=1 Tax=Nitratireductor pacificus pht-3B TaxID=391937 RepID=K2MDY1_9HYPH|nr:FAD-binding oxidoreductase [Nitratireductor pacificus]EKF20371.1 FAD dependent oxidoreductase [Nitratireductor pacificus pht-3B]